MSTEKISATIDQDVLNEIRKTVGARRVSAFLSEAAREKLQRARILSYLDELDAKHGAPDPRVSQAASRRLARLLGR